MGKLNWELVRWDGSGYIDALDKFERKPEKYIEEFEDFCDFQQQGVATADVKLKVLSQCIQKTSLLGMKIRRRRARILSHYC